MGFVIAVLCIGLLFGGLGFYIATQKGRSSGEGFLLGFLFGPLGCLIVALLPTPKSRPSGGSTPRRSRPRSVWTPDYRDDWDAPKPEKKPDRSEDEAMKYLTGE
jgi:hypothetical protein